MGHPLWVVTRDAHRHTWMASALAEVLAARPDAVVIDTGWPGWQPADGTALVVTRGASRASGAAVVELLGR
jgi:beta-N-acetylhexosaminidase